MTIRRKGVFYAMMQIFFGLLCSSADKESTCNCRRIPFNSWVRKIRWGRDKLPTPVLLAFPGGLTGKESTHNAGDWDLIPGLGRFLGEGNSYPLQYSGLENSMDCIVHGVAKSRTQLINSHFQIFFILIAVVVT